MNADTSATECPKCGRRIAAAPTAGAPADPAPRPESCPRCGLVFSLWTAEQAQALARLDDRAEALWAAAEASWRTPEPHEAFVRHCSQEGLLPAAGRRYRARLDRDPTDAMAARMQERILAMATASFVRPTAPTPVTRSSWFWAVMLVCCLAGIAGALFLRR